MERAGQHRGAHLYVDLSCERRAARPIELPSFFGPGAYGPAHAAHMATWHP
jgi:hypothetical protein